MPEPEISVYKSLFHYTTAEGLERILHTQSLWATHYRFMNDLQELQLFKRVIVNHLGLGEDISKEDKQRFVDEVFLPRLKELDELCPAYLTCFSLHEKPHDEYEYINGRLSQWRGYGKDGGYAIEFDTKILKELLDNEGKYGAVANLTRYTAALSFSNVCYFWEDQNKLVGPEGVNDPSVQAIEDDLKRLVEIIKMFHLNRGVIDHQTAHESMCLIAKCASRIKHYGFHEEKEVRIVGTASNKAHFNYIKKVNNNCDIPFPKTVYFRPKDKVPYIALFEEDRSENFKKAIVGIIVGPGNHQERRETMVNMMINQHGYNDVNIRCSDIPYIV